MLDSNIVRAELENMPASLRVLSDMYFHCRMAKEDNKPCHIAVQNIQAELKKLTAAPTLLTIKTMLQHFQSIEDTEIQAAMFTIKQLQKMPNQMKHVSLAQRNDFYSGRMVEQWNIKK
jgi:hypothetical protein